MAIVVAGMLLVPVSVLAAESQAADSASSAVNIDDELVYLDPDGRIIVLDPYTVEDMPRVEWQSPIDGFDNIALGDFNADGDDEIAAVSVSNGNLLIVYDPVAEGIDPADADGYSNGIPWQTLYAEELPGEPMLVATGQLDIDSSAMELITYVRLDEADRINPDDTYSMVVRKPTGEIPDGRTWALLYEHNTGADASWIGTGNIDGQGVDDIVQVSYAEGALYIYVAHESNHTLERIFRSTTPKRAWRIGAIGQFIVGSEEEIALSRDAKFPEPTLYVSHHVVDGDIHDLEDYFLGYNDPPPNVLFFADIAGNNDQELVALRALTGSQQNKPRMFIRDGGMGEYVDAINMGEPELDDDNGYRSGVGADVDGDGRQEIIIMRDNNIRIYTEPETYPTEENYPVSTNQEDIVAGNLDANGLANVVRIHPEPSVLAATLSAAEKSTPFGVQVADTSTDSSVSVAFTVADNSNWVGLSETSAETPTILEVTLDGTGLSTGIYTDSIKVTTRAGALSIPESIELRLTVEPGAKIEPDEVNVAVASCETATTAIIVNVSSEGTPGGSGVISLRQNVAWASISSGAGTIPHTAFLTLEGRKLDGAIGQVDLVLNATIDGKSYSDTARVTLLCANTIVYAPYITQ